jgi:hypothetical protein
MDSSIINSVLRLNNNTDFKVFVELLQTFKKDEIERMIKEAQIDNVRIAQGKVRMIDIILRVIEYNITPSTNNKPTIGGGV